MSRETKTKHIGDYDYTTTQLGAIEGRRLLVRLLRVAGPALGALAGKEAALSAGLAKLSESLTDEDLTYVCDLFARNSSVKLDLKREPQLDGVFDDHFAGKYLEMCQWLAFCMEANYAGFFQGLAARKSAAADPEVKA